MHCRELIEVAALVAAHGPVLVEGPGRISSSALHQYWAASKCRLDRWLRSLKGFAALEHQPAEDAAGLAAEIHSVLEEILLAEIAPRVWTAVLYAYDRRRKTDEAEPIARSVLLGHLDVRQRALALLIHCPHITAAEAVELNRLRRRAERWTDLLLGYLGQHYPVRELAFDPDRSSEFAADLRQQQRKSAGDQSWRLTLASLRMAFGAVPAEAGPGADTNLDIAGSILACFPAELFSATGELHGLWLVRLTHAVSDAQGMVDELLGTEPPSRMLDGGLPVAPVGGSHRHRRF